MTGSLVFRKFLLFVTGEGEERILPLLLRQIQEGGRCTLQVARRVPQLSPRQADVQSLRIAGTKSKAHTRDDELGLAVRRVLQSDPTVFALLVDDLEGARTTAQQDVFNRYRTAIDRVIKDDQTRARASVHFLVNMVEAYYFADPQAVNAALGLAVAQPTSDVEAIHHPKNELKILMRALRASFDEKRDGERVAGRTSLDRILAQAGWCASLRTLVAWCVDRQGLPFGDRWALANGRYNQVTAGQIPVAVDAEGWPDGRRAAGAGGDNGEADRTDQP